MHSNPNLTHGPVAPQSENLCRGNIDNLSCEQIEHIATEWASDEYGQGWAEEAALQAATWLREYAGETLDTSAQQWLDPSVLRHCIIATRPFGTNNLYEQISGKKVPAETTMLGISVRGPRNSYRLIVVDDQSDSWSNLSRPQQQLWAYRVRAYCPPEADPDFLQRAAMVFARDNKLRSAVNEEVIHAVQDRSLPTLVQEVLARYLEYQMPLGNLHPPEDMLRCFTHVHQLVARYGKQAIARLNFGTLDDPLTRQQLIDQIQHAAPGLFDPAVYHHYAAYDRK